MKCVIHAGKHKTGTTMVQSLLHDNQKILLDNKVLYPSTPDAIHHNFILDPFHKDYSPELLTSIADGAKRSGVELLLMSAEVVSTLPAEQLKQITDCLSGCESISFLICLRHWDSFLPSRYAQSCKRRDSQTYAEYLKSVSEVSLRHWDFYYDVLLENFFASGHSVKIISYDHAVREKGLAAAILDAAGLSGLLDNKLLGNSGKINESNPWEINELLRLMNGVAANQVQVLQNPLFDQLAHGSRTDFSFFDFDRVLDQLEARDVASCVEWISENSTPLPKIPESHIQVEEKIMTTFGSHTVNSIGGCLFPAVPKGSSVSQVSSITWPEFIEWNPFLVRQLVTKALELTNLALVSSRGNRATRALARIRQRYLKH